MIWSAVRAAEPADLLIGGNPLKANQPYMKSPEGWGLHVIRRGGSVLGPEIPDTIGLVFTRGGQETVDHTGRIYSSDPRIHAHAARRLDRNAPRFTDAYVWLQPEARGEGVSTIALERAIPHIEVADVRVPFDIDPANVPAQRLVEQYTVPEQVAA
ncbi:MAG TPA: hypothetical protein VN554_01975 [Verrucomicrobiae bacterium]|nr:hypothetical protein [Verrucomicrobiae bacterium]